MRLRYFCIAPLLLAAAFCLGKPSSQENLVVHEWGTFLSMSGSDGVTLDGMYHEEHALPAFVHARSRDQLHLPSASLKGETPVIYFYTSQRQEVRVKVRFPLGVWTQWYPQASQVGPSLTQLGGHLKPRLGHIAWNLEVVPAGEGKSAPPLPKTASDALWNYARDVDAAYVRTTDETKSRERNEYERFLFYRGLGQATLPLRVSHEDGGTLSIGAASAYGARHLFVLRVENGKGVYKYIPALAPGERLTNVIPTMQGAQPLPTFTARIADDLAAKLTESGLYAKEGRAMVNTWKTSYFQNDGIRVLYVLPQEWTDEFIPMEISPKPRSLVRVMVGRTELLAPERERRAEASVRDLASADSAKRESAFAFLRDQGRYVEPILRRALQTSHEEKTRTLCKRLLLTGFVNELRSSVHAAGDGSRLTDAPVNVRAQLASLLREIGLDAEAKAEAAIAWDTLKAHKTPPINESESRHYFRAYARAMEGLGDDTAAAQGYAKFISFASQVKTGCAGCHSGVTAPRNMAWFRDWYAGRKYADCLTRLGQTDAAIAEQKAKLEQHPNDTAAQMRLAYLYENRGEKERADQLWARMEGRPQQAIGRAPKRTATSP